MKNFIEQNDPAVWRAIADEMRRQQDGLELIASENYTSPAVMQAAGSVLTNKYAEGYPGKRYYGGCEFVDVVEQLANVDLLSDEFDVPRIAVAKFDRCTMPSRLRHHAFELDPVADDLIESLLLDVVLARAEAADVFAPVFCGFGILLSVFEDLRELAEGLVVGEDPVLDAKRFRVSEKGICLITQDMVDRLG